MTSNGVGTEGGSALGDRDRLRRLPTVSVFLPVRNESEGIEACLEALLQQDYPQHLMEVLVVDGCSEDGTPDLVRRVQARHPHARIRLLVNRRRTAPPALNIGIRHARGEVLVRMDGHAVPARDYVSRCVAALERTGAANVGGVLLPVGRTPFGEAVALATQHPLGAGDARYRVGGDAGDVDTVAYGAFRRDVFERVGMFDESMVRNEDYELNVRIRTAGERIHFDPTIRVSYTPRGTPGDLWRQYFQYGWWRVETVRRYPSSLRWRQALPPAFVLGLILLLVTSLWSLLAACGLLTIGGAYVAAVLGTAWRLARPPASAATVTLAVLVMHFAYGVGFLMGIVSLGRFPYRTRPPSAPCLGEDPPEPIQVPSELGAEAKPSASAAGLRIEPIEFNPGRS